MKNLNPNKHYVNKKHTKHYYLGNEFTNKEWEAYTQGKIVKGIRIGILDKHRIIPKQCERIFMGKDKMAHSCTNSPFFKCDNNGLYFCKACAHDIDKTANINLQNPITFSRIT